jgi:hypothetical protein
VFANTSYVIFFLGLIGLPLLGLSLEKRIGGVASSALGMCGGVIGFILAVAWRETFIGSAMPEVWPDDYARLADSVVRNANLWWAAVSVYVPTLVVILKMFHADLWADVLSSMKRGK